MSKVGYGVGDAVPGIDFMTDEEFEQEMQGLENEQDDQEQTLDFEGVIPNGVAENTDTKPLPFDPKQEMHYGIDPLYFIGHISELVEDVESFTLEQEKFLVTLPESSFVEYCAQLHNLSESAARAQGMLLWKRLVNQLGFEMAVRSQERNSQIGTWAAKFNTDYQRIERRILDAMSRSLVPETEQLSPTGGAEIARGIESSREDVIKDTIEERLEATRSLDPTMERSTEAVRAAKKFAEAGNHQPSIIKQKNLNPQPVYPEWTFYGNVKVGESHTDEGEIVEHYEYRPIYQVYLEDSRVEAERPQIQEFQNLGMKRLGGKVSNERIVEDGAKETDDEQSKDD
jgi:hypothetical protein